MFVTLCRRGGAAKGSSRARDPQRFGDSVDQYTTWDWAPLCDTADPGQIFVLVIGVLSTSTPTSWDLWIDNITFY